MYEGELAAAGARLAEALAEAEASREECKRVREASQRDVERSAAAFEERLRSLRQDLRRSAELRADVEAQLARTREEADQMAVRAGTNSMKAREVAEELQKLRVELAEARMARDEAGAALERTSARLQSELDRAKEEVAETAARLRAAQNDLGHAVGQRDSVGHWRGGPARVSRTADPLPNQPRCHCAGPSNRKAVPRVPAHARGGAAAGGQQAAARRAGAGDGGHVHELPGPVPGPGHRAAVRAQLLRGMQGGLRAGVQGACRAATGGWVVGVTPSPPQECTLAGADGRPVDAVHRAVPDDRLNRICGKVSFVQQALAFLKEQHRLAQSNRAEYDEVLGLDVSAAGVGEEHGVGSEAKEGAEEAVREAKG